MAKNLIPEICKMLSVELGEEFEIEGYKGAIYQFTDDELIVRSENDAESVYITANMTLVSLLTGKREIVKMPWKPKRKDEYWTFYINGNNKLDIYWNIWTEEIAEFARLKAGWIYHSRAEAQAALPAVAKEVGVEYELPSTEIVEPWKPEKGDTYYTFELVGGKWIVHLLWWAGTPNGYALLDKGWIFRTKEEAEAALPKVAKKLGVEYAL